MASREHVLYRSALMLAAFGLTALLWERLPDRMATHWGLDGRPDSWGGRITGALLLPMIGLALWGLTELLPKLDPRQENFARMRSTYEITISASLTLLVVMHAAVLATALGYSVPIGRVAPAGVGMLLVIVGNLLPRARPNWWFGIRTPWTLSDDRVWTVTHRIGGFLFVGAGVVLIAAAVALPTAWIAHVLIVVTFAAGLGSMVYSYVAWRRTKRSRS